MTIPKRGKRPIKLVRQAARTECAQACIAMIANHHGMSVDLQYIRERFGISLRGTSVSRIREIAVELGFECRIYAASIDNVKRFAKPVILHWSGNHFVVLAKYSKGRFHIFDPAYGKLVYDEQTFEKKYSGTLIHVDTDRDHFFGDFTSKNADALPIGKISGAWKSGLGIFIVGIAIECISLVFPYQLRWVIDGAIDNSSVYSLAIVGAIYVSFSLVQYYLSAVKSRYITTAIGSVFQQWAMSLIAHLLKLPIPYFQNRQLGDVLARIGSVDSIESTVSSSFIDSFIDGILAIITIVFIFNYNYVMAVISLCIISIYVSSRFIINGKLKKLSDAWIIEKGAEQGELIEIVRSIPTIRVAAAEGFFLKRLSESAVPAREVLNKIQGLTLGVVNLRKMSLQIHRIVLISVGAYLSSVHVLTVGMLAAFLVYAEQLSGRAANLADKICELSLISTHLERLKDITDSEPEVIDEVAAGSGVVLDRAEIEIDNVSFRYSPSDPLIFDGLNLVMRSGASYAIIGKSGRGKSTLAKLILGLMEPSSGSVRINGENIQNFGLQRYRGIVAGVLQQDTLFRGSIAENISTFDRDADLNDVMAAARTAAIHEDIKSLPMGYATEIGNMGMSLSGGQAQRLILARALYRKPLVLVLDEATSNLDGKTESEISDMLRRITSTRIIFAHRQETIDAADFIIDLDEAVPRVARNKISANVYPRQAT